MKMKSKCPKCGSINFESERRLNGFRKCYDCGHSWQMGTECSEEDRIAPFLEKFKKLWENYPELRFMQMIAAIQVVAQERFNIDDLYYLEESQLTDIINDIITNGEVK
jgi:hypothetical protein